MASHRGAAKLHVLRGFDRAPVEVTCRRWRRAREGGIVIHETLAHDVTDTEIVDGIPATTIARTLVDLGAVVHPSVIGRALDEARRRGQTSLEAVDLMVAGRSVQGRNGIVPVRALIEERQGRLLASTGFEELLLRIVDEFGLPQPELQWPVRDGAFAAFLDFAYPDHRLAIEADSEEYHLDLETFHRDRTRQNRLSLLGWSFLRFTARHLRYQRRSVATQIATALGVEI